MTTGLATSVLGLLQAKEGDHGRDLPADPLAYGVGAFALFVVLLLITLSFGKDR